MKEEFILELVDIISQLLTLFLNPETGVISPQYHCVFDDTFSTVWSDGQFDPIIWDYLIQQVDRHFTIEPDSDGHVTLPNDFSPFAPDIPACGGPIPQPSTTGPLLLPTIMKQLMLLSQHNQHQY